MNFLSTQQDSTAGAEIFSGFFGGFFFLVCNYLLSKDRDQDVWGLVSKIPPEINRCSLKQLCHEVLCR